MAKYLTAFRNYLFTELEYRSNLVGHILMELLGLGTVIFIFADAFNRQETVAGYTQSDLLNYYLIIPAIGFLTQVKLSDVLGYEIKDGKISHILMKPLHLSTFFLMRTLGGKVILWMVCLPLYAIVYVIALYWGVSLFNTNWQGLMAAGLLILGAFWLHYSIEYMLTGLAFFLDDVWALEHFKNIVVGIFGGLSFPLTFLPKAWQFWFEILPFKFLYYTPLLYVLGKRELTHLLEDLVTLTIWAIIAMFLGRIIWTVGLRKYGAYGN